MASGNGTPTLEPGQSIGRYRVIELLGAGGMGEVYRAHDPSLERNVAIKIVAAAGCTNPEWLRLFEQEARGAASLNHPNVVAIYDATADESRACIVFELLDGDSLRQRLQRQDITPSKAVSYAIQIADGLSAIHAKGMIHRDLKPENVFVTHGDLVKILDFGIAKILETGRLEGETETEGSTDPGRHGGTIGYMSPEQIKGEGVDSRSDIFSFGLILYEMLARRRAFEGKTASVIAGILTQEPPSLPARNVPIGLRRIVHRCLEKRPDQRFHTAHDLALALRLVAADLETPRHWGRMALVGGAAVLAIAAIVIAKSTVGRRRATPSKALSVEPETIPLTSAPGLEYQPVLSRDGTQVAYVWNGSEGGANFDIYTKSVDRQTTFRLTSDPASECCPAWSPDGKSVAFLRIHESEADLITMPAMGGPERKIRTVHPWFGSAVTWSPDGRSLGFSDRHEPGRPFQIAVLSLNTGAVKTISQPERSLAGDGLPTFSPDGTQIAYVRLPGLGDAFQWSEIEVFDLDSARETRVIRDSSLVGGLDWTPGGDELVFSASAPGGSAKLWRVALADHDRKLVGDGIPLSNVTGAEAFSAVSRMLRVSVAAAAHRLAFARGSYDTDIWAVAPTGTATESKKLIASTRLDEAPQYSPDGRRIAFASDRNSPTSQIWVCSAAGTECEQITSFAAGCGTPRWSPDGRRIAFDAAPEGQTDIYIVEVASKTVTRMTSAPSHEAAPSWSRDGRSIYVASDRTGDWQVWKIAVDGSGDERVTRDGGYIAFEGLDGRTLFYVKDATFGLFSRTADGRETRLTGLPQCKGYWALAPDGVYLVDSNAPQGPVLDLFRFATQRIEVVRPLPGEVACGETGLAATADGRSLAYVSVNRGSDLLLIDKFH